MHQVYLNAAFGSPPAVFGGLQLQRLTLAHCYVLEAFGSPYLLGDECGLPDAALAAYVCSRDAWPFDSYADPVEMAKRAEREMAKRAKTMPADALRADLAKLAEYFSVAKAKPDRHFAEGEAMTGTRAPWPLMVATRIMPLVGEARAWTMPLPLATAYKVAVDVQSGDSSWQTEEQAAVARMNDEERKA